MNRLWSFPEPIQLEGALAVSRCLDLAPGLALILAKMGLVEEQRARQFLFPRLRDLRDPLDIGGMKNAADRIFQSIDRQETVVLFGDYDVDGVTSVALLQRTLKAFGADVRAFSIVEPLRLTGSGKLRQVGSTWSFWITTSRRGLFRFAAPS
jgi:single-stranded-DNA-specific exonuclease